MTDSVNAGARVSRDTDGSLYKLDTVTNLLGLGTCAEEQSDRAEYSRQKPHGQFPSINAIAPVRSSMIPYPRSVKEARVDDHTIHRIVSRVASLPHGALPLAVCRVGIAADDLVGELGGGLLVRLRFWARHWIGNVVAMIGIPGFGNSFV